MTVRTYKDPLTTIGVRTGPIKKLIKLEATQVMVKNMVYMGFQKGVCLFTTSFVSTNFTFFFDPLSVSVTKKPPSIDLIVL